VWDSFKLYVEKNTGVYVMNFFYTIRVACFWNGRNVDCFSLWKHGRLFCLSMMLSVIQYLPGMVHICSHVTTEAI